MHWERTYYLATLPHLNFLNKTTCFLIHRLGMTQEKSAKLKFGIGTTQFEAISGICDSVNEAAI